VCVSLNARNIFLHATKPPRHVACTTSPQLPLPITLIYTTTHSSEKNVACAQLTAHTVWISAGSTSSNVSWYWLSVGCWPNSGARCTYWRCWNACVEAATTALVCGTLSTSVRSMSVGSSSSRISNSFATRKQNCILPSSSESTSLCWQTTGLLGCSRIVSLLPKSLKCRMMYDAFCEFGRIVIERVAESTIMEQWRRLTLWSLRQQTKKTKKGLKWSFFKNNNETLLNICDLYQTQYFLLLINELVHRYHSHPTEQDSRQTNRLHDSSDVKKKKKTVWLRTIQSCLPLLF